MLFSLLKHYLELYITDTALKISRSLYCFTTSIFHGVENYFPKLWGTGISDAILIHLKKHKHLKLFISIKRSRKFSVKTHPTKSEEHIYVNQLFILQ